jgi:pyruvate dehydrogenase E1 component alpha subunit
MSTVAAIYDVARSECDGNNVLDVHAATALASELCRAGKGPVIVTATSFRMGGESRAILPEGDFVYWGKRDPIGMYESYLADAPWKLSAARSNREALEAAEAEVEAEVAEAERLALESRASRQPDPATQRKGVFAE